MGIKLRQRKTQKIQNSLWVSIPFEWANYHKLEKGTIIDVELYENGDALILRPAPEIEEVPHV